MPSNDRKFIINPYIAGTPVKDPTMFFGREDVYAWLRQHLQGKYQDNAIVLYGERRTGKTSVLYHMKDNLDSNRYVPVLLDLQGMGLEGIDGFLWEVARKIVITLRGVEGVPLLDRPSRRDFESNPRDQFENNFLLPILAALGDRRLLFLFDETARLEEKVQLGELPDDVFNYLRALIQEVNQINFIFSTGNRLEVVRKSSIKLFNLAVYRKISFLEQDFAEDLIIRPVAKHYGFTKVAIDRILYVTSGQPYYIQLLCHNLFARWTEKKTKLLDVEDVEAVLHNVIEQSSPNLQFIWYTSTPVEKVILSAMASISPRYQGGIMLRSLNRALRKAELYPPDGEMTRGLITLFERDLINNNEPYEFRIKLLQMWLTEFKKLKWLHDELRETAKQWEQDEKERLAKAPTPLDYLRHWAAPVTVGLLAGILIAVIFIWQNIQQSTTALDDAEMVRLTEVAQLKSTIAASYTEVARNPQSKNMVNTVATNIASTLAASEKVQKEATGTAAAVQIDKLSIQVSNAQTTLEAAKAELAILTNITSTPTASATPTSSATLTPSATATPSLLGKLAIPVYNGRQYNIHIYSLPGGNLLKTVPNARQPEFQSSGEQLAVNLSGNGVWIYNSDGTNGRPISYNSSDSHPSFSPNRHNLVYTNRETMKDGVAVWRIFVQNGLNGGGNTNLLAGDILDASTPLYPLWTDEGKIIFYACNYWFHGSVGRCGVWKTSSAATVDRTGFQIPVNITNQKEIPTDSYGKDLLVMGETNGNWELYLTSTNSGKPLTNRSNYPGNDGLGTFSPDGWWIAFVSFREGRWGVWVVPTAGDDTAKRLPINDLNFGTDNYNWTTERISWGQ